MPELPEVDSLRSSLEGEVLGKRIERLVLKEEGGGPRTGLYDELVFNGVKEEEIRKAIQGRIVSAVRRRGKHMWVELMNDDAAETKGGAKRRNAASEASSPGIHVVFHMGMTGSLVFRHREVQQYKSFSISADAWPPKFTKVEFIFENDIRLAYCDPRRWGRILLRENALVEPPISDLAPDALTDLPNLEDFSAKIRSSDISIKAVLLNQQKVVSGIGNYVADEILYQAKVDPAKKSRSLTEQEIKEIHHYLHEVCDVASKAHAANQEFPDHWLFHHRWTNKAKGSKMPNGASIVFETIGGRTTAIVPFVQRARGKNAVAAAVAVAEEKEEVVVEGGKEKGGKGKKKKVVATTKRKEGVAEVRKVQETMSITKAAVILPETPIASSNSSNKAVTRSSKRMKK